MTSKKDSFILGIELIIGDFEVSNQQTSKSAAISFKLSL